MNQDKNPSSKHQNQQIALDLLLKRKSHNRLGGQALTKEQLETLFQAAFRAPDHAQLKPWRYQVYSGQSLAKLGDYFIEASKAESETQLTSEQLEKIHNKALRAPTLIVAYLSPKEHPKVPHVEQVLSLGASIQNLLMAAHFLGVGAIWRSGKLCFNPHLAKLLGLKTHESLLGFIYLGEKEGTKRPVPEVEQSQLVSYID
ncbi:MAG: nitroreductase [Enterobacterales bacterium]|nr:nitroreductase [Enterobacterales bacterium]